MVLNAAMAHNTAGPNALGPKPHPDTLEKADFDALLRAVGQDRDRESFVKLYDYFAPRVKSFLMKGGAAEEQADEWAQETMLTIWQKAPSFDSKKASASTWIFTIARNKKIDALRKVRHYDFTPDDSVILADTREDQRARIIRQEEEDNIALALDDLPPEQADLIRKSFFEDKSHSDIAAETGLPLGTVKSRIRMALEKLRHKKEVKALW